MFERMEIYNNIYERVVEPYYKKTARANTNCAGHSRKMMEEAITSTIYSNTSRYYGKHNQRYIDCPSYRSKITCLIYGNTHSS